MKRFLLAATALLFSSLPLSPAASARAPLMYGYGVTAGTMLAPGQYPTVFPKQIRQNEDSDIEKVWQDFHFGVEALAYATTTHRFAASATLGFGKNYRDRNFILKYSRVFVWEAGEIVAGGGAGVGRSVYRTDGKEELSTPYYPLRVEIGPMFRYDFMAFQPQLYGQYNVTWAHFYTNGDGEEEDVGTGLYGMIGLELNFYLGEFRTPI